MDYLYEKAGVLSDSDLLERYISLGSVAKHSTFEGPQWL